jgi:hypothetical protein
MLSRSAIPPRRTFLSSPSAVGSKFYISTITVTTLQRTNAENSKQIFQEKEWRGPSPNFHTHLSVSDLYNPTIDLPILLQENMWTDPGHIEIAHRHMHECGNWELGCAIPRKGDGDGDVPPLSFFGPCRKFLSQLF